MRDDKNLNRQPHWRCRLCGHSTPLGQAVCSNPSCQADLGIYGEAVTPDQEDDSRRAWKQWSEEAQQREEETRRQEEEARQRSAEAQRRRDEVQRQQAEEQQRRAEKQARSKAAGGTPKWLVPVLAVALVAALCVGAGLFLAGRGAGGSDVPSWSSADPGLDSTRPEDSDVPGPNGNKPGQGESPAPGAWKGNVLMADPNLNDVNDRGGYPVFGSDLLRKDVTSITFLNSLDNMHGSGWDVSQAQDGSVMAWVEGYDLYIGAQGGVEAPEDCSALFAGYACVETISFNGAFHTENVTNMKYMFNRCSGLRELDVSGFDTSKVTNMSYMFNYCSGLQELDVSGFDTSKVTDMSDMFSVCSGLRELNVSNFDTSNVAGMSCMFNFCESLQKLDVSGLGTSNVTDMSGMFLACRGLRELNVSNFDTSNVTDMSCMFYSCSGLQELDVSNFDTSNVTSMSYMFGYCRGLRELDVSSFDTSNVTKMSYMFSNCSGLASLDITNFKTSNVTNMSHMFDGVNNGFALHFVRENFDTSNVETYDSFMSDSFDWRKMFE